MKKTKFTSMQMSLIKSGLIGATISILLIIVLSLLSAMVINKNVIELDNSKIIAWAIVFLSCFTGSALAGKLSKGNKIASSGIVCAIVLIIQLAVAILLFDGIYNNIFVGILPVLAGFGCAILLKFKGKSQLSTKKRRGHRR